MPVDPEFRKKIIGDAEPVTCRPADLIEPELDKYRKEIGEYIYGIGNYTAHAGAVQWAFSLAIFFLGMSAAFLGDIVEKDIHKSSLIATIFFTVGMLGPGAAILLKSLPLVFLFYGCIMGIGLGTGYLAPSRR